MSAAVTNQLCRSHVLTLTCAENSFVMNEFDQQRSVVCFGLLTEEALFLDGEEDYQVCASHPNSSLHHLSLQ